MRNFPRKRIYATKKPGDYQVELPGDLLQIDTWDLRFNTGNTFKGFAALDTLSAMAFLRFTLKPLPFLPGNLQSR
ncbi:MAG: hypothetical protein QMD88_04885 [Coprothermobacterota bacterium]|nr:hypothetical protein [Coprothermobacterota bacterium]